MDKDVGQWKRRSDLIARLCVRGSNDLVVALYRRLLADQGLPREEEAEIAPTWEEVAGCACTEGLISSRDRELLLLGVVEAVASGGREG